MLIPLIALCTGLLLFSLILLLFGGKAAKQDAVTNRLDRLSRDASRAWLIRDEELAKPFTERVIRPAIQKLSAMLSSLLPVRNRENAGAEKQKKLLQQAGWTISPAEYTTLQLILMVCCGLLGILTALLIRTDLLHGLLYFVFGVFAAYTVLRYVCSSAATRRKTAMEKQLPDMLDLLSVSVAAGLGFERAMLHIIETMDGPLIDELAVSYREMSMGRSRKDALTLLGERCGIEDLSSVTSALVQAGQLGIPIRNVLQSQSAALRRARRSRVQEKAAKVSTKMLLPMVGLIFPVLIIVLMGPSLITIVEELK